VNRRPISAIAVVVLIGAGIVTGAPEASPTGGGHHGGRGGGADSPTVVPATGGSGNPSMLGMFTNVSAIGYQLSEHFVSGNAHSYGSGAPLTPDGKWDAITADAATAPYTTRVLVMTPANPDDFNGTVYIEWLNVSGGLDASPDWTHGHLEIARQGAAYVGVSAQSRGIDQLKSATGPPVPGDPARYAPLSHPGDSYSYDMFSQAGQAVRDGKLLGDLRGRRFIAAGESQSAGRLVTYVNAVHPLVDVFDGFLVHSRGRSGAALRQDPLGAIPAPVPTAIREDDREPVLVFQDETDVANALLEARQRESWHGRFRLWEVAGTAHFDSYGLAIGPGDIGDGNGELQAFQHLQHPLSSPVPGFIECALPVNAGPQHWVINASLRKLSRWVAHGKAPRIAPRIEATTAPGVAPVAFVTDEHGNVRGGIRTPFVDAPIARLTGTGNSTAPGGSPTSTFCSIFGLTVPFTAEQFAARYPTPAHFVWDFAIASLRAYERGHLTEPDVLNLVLAAVKTYFPA
jgi:hypothetical protein